MRKSAERQRLRLAKKTNRNRRYSNYRKNQIFREAIRKTIRQTVKDEWDAAILYGIDNKRIRELVDDAVDALATAMAAASTTWSDNFNFHLNRVTE